MKLFVLRNSVTSFRLYEFHLWMCHGVAWRDGLRGVNCPPVYLGGGRQSPLSLEVNAYRLRDVVQQPGDNLIVSARARDALRRLPRIEFLPVEFKKVAWFPYDEDDHSFYEYPEEFLVRNFGENGRAFSANEERLNDLLADPSGLYDLLENSPEARAKLQPYYELLTWRLQDAMPAGTDVQPVEALITTPFDTPYPLRVAVKITREVCLAYPILWSTSGIILSELAFDLLAPFLDREYFGVGVADI